MGSQSSWETQSMTLSESTQDGVPQKRGQLGKAVLWQAGGAAGAWGEGRAWQEGGGARPVPGIGDCPPCEAVGRG